MPTGRNNSFAERVKRTGADVAIDDADAAKHECLEAGGGMRIAMPIGRRGFHGGNYNIAGHRDGGLKNASLHHSKGRRLIALR